MIKNASATVTLCALSVFAFWTPGFAFGDVTENETSVRSVNRQQGSTIEVTESGDGWLQLNPGFRPVFVGIHGGTAPVSVLRSSDGGLVTLTGQTGNDFMRVLHNKTAGVQTAQGSGSDFDAGSVSFLPDFVPTQTPSIPFGLTHPEGVEIFQESTVAAVAGKGSYSFKPLKLGSYQRVLAHAGRI